MPTLELPNLTAYNRAKALSPPPVTSQSLNQPVGASSQTQTQTTSCQPGLQLCVEQGATLNSQIALTVTSTTGVTTPVNITGNKFEFTAKTNPSISDTDPSVIKVDWTETTTPTQGTTWLTVPAAITATMQAVPYYYQVRMVQSPTSPTPIVTPLFSGTLIVVKPVSPRS